jgi:hypothetical protein
MTPDRSQLSTGSAEPRTGWWTRAPAFVLEAGVIAALLYFFGWIRTQATYAVLGVNISLLDLPATVYVQRGVNAVLIPLLTFGLAAFAVTALHRWLLPRKHSKPGRIFRYLIRTAGYIALALTAAGLIEPASVGLSLGLCLPIALLGGAAAIAYADHLSSRSKPASKFGVRVSVLATFIVIGAAWVIALYAQRLGERYALDFGSSLPDQPKVVLDAAERLAIAGPGVKVEPITQESSRYHFRYEGLRMLISDGGEYILAPEGWIRGQSALVIVPKDETRIDLIARP